MRPVGSKSGVSSRRVYARQISCASPARDFRLGSMPEKKRHRFSMSRLKKNSARLLAAGFTICGKSMMVGPFHAIRML
jgi:hypothetical protein